MISQISKKTGANNYNPEIVYVMVNKKISSRFFTAQQDNPQQGNKFLPKVFNPNSGSVIVE